MKEKTVIITKETDGVEQQVEVRVRYCAAVETGYEQLRGKSIGSLSESMNYEDWIAIGISAIVAAYERIGEQPPVNSSDILYTAKPAEIYDLFKAVMELRAEWYGVPGIMKEETSAEKPSKN